MCIRDRCYAYCMEVVTMIHEMKLNNNAFNNIKSGIKKFELRLYDDRRKNINLGDTIIFHNLNNLNNTISVTFLALFTQMCIRDRLLSL